MVRYGKDKNIENASAEVLTLSPGSARTQLRAKICTLTSP
jgi:hypothetical protein